MMKKLPNASALERHLGCFGEFDIQDPVCQKLCALSVRCAVTRDHNARMEILEDMVTAEELPVTIQ